MVISKKIQLIISLKKQFYMTKWSLIYEKMKDVIKLNCSFLENNYWIGMQKKKIALEIRAKRNMMRIDANATSRALLRIQSLFTK